MSTWMQMNFQDCNSYMMMMMSYFHDLILMILLMILVFILYIMVWFFSNMFINLNILHNQLIEIIWTIIPMIILIFLAIPSLNILYEIEEILNSYLTIKILGHQWYWSYEYSDYFFIDFDSFMINVEENFNFRLLDVDNRLILPSNLKIRGLVTSIDVIHSWAMPSLGLKVDAIPGRMNQFISLVNRVGLYFGHVQKFVV
uniref:Cytochrome c oxidase subunit 2 n=1 Tax=Capitonius sp. QL-2013 TaxID=1421593 RepID=A0A0A6ZLP7_9HYME|nr:cytochrome c oxidase subunit II [Capitonius sp. QL-2013]